ncbi:TetR/AcrR family transcriptional regulator [Spirosoma pulveris]
MSINLKDEKMIVNNKKNSQVTRQAILNSFRAVVARKGLDQISIREVADEAGVSAVLIYRYFGGLYGLITTFIQDSDLHPKWSRLDQLFLKGLTEENNSKVWYLHFRQIINNHKELKEYREILKATIKSDQETGMKIGNLLDDQLVDFFSNVPAVKNVDTQMISTLLLGGLSYISILASDNKEFMHMDFNSEDNWQRVDAAIKTILLSLNTAEESNS